MSTRQLSDLMEELRLHAEQEFERGVRVGEERYHARLMAFMARGGGPLHGGAAGAPSPPAIEAAIEGEEGARRPKAPKGLAEKIVKGVLKDHPSGLPLDELETKVVEADSRIAIKSVYNHLNANRLTLYRRDSNNVWHLRPSSSEFA
jgi:hypothetical protein